MPYRPEGTKIKEVNTKYLCKDCGVLVWPLDFKLKDSIWKNICDDKRDLICLHCSETRLGRILTIEDFSLVASNNGIFFGYKMGQENV